MLALDLPLTCYLEEGKHKVSLCLKEERSDQRFEIYHACFETIPNACMNMNAGNEKFEDFMILYVKFSEIFNEIKLLLRFKRPSVQMY